jgi:hypothetical protein
MQLKMILLKYENVPECKNEHYSVYCSANGSSYTTSKWLSQKIKMNLKRVLTFK